MSQQATEHKEQGNKPSDEVKVDYSKARLVQNNKDNLDMMDLSDQDSITTTNGIKNSNNNYKYHIIMMGDSVLDNFYWVQDKRNDIRNQIENTFESNNLNPVKVSNYAVDESTTSTVLNGHRPSSNYIYKRRQLKMDEYEMESNGKVYPLRLLSKLNVNQYDINKPIVVLSAGGNDIRVNLFNGYNKEMKNVLKTMRKNLLKLTQDIIFKNNCNLILCLCYEPYIDFCNSFNMEREILIKIFEHWMSILLDIGNKYHLPILDISRTFNPLKRSHFGSTYIEPSNKSGQFIADLVMYITKDFYSYNCNSKKQESKVYYGYGQNIKCELNDTKHLNNNKKTYFKSKFQMHPSKRY